MQVLSTIAAAATLVTLALSQSITKLSDFSGSPTKLGMYVYVPSTFKAGSIVVAIHHCQGSATAYSTESHYMPLADQHNFMLIYPTSRSSGGCFEFLLRLVPLTHNGGGDSQTIANMVTYAISKYGADKDRVFVTGTSSGAMMTNLMAGAYPDVFKAASAYSGVPDGCFYVSGATATQDPPGWSNSCANGQNTPTAAQWGDMVRGYYPGYNGTRPRMQIWHGTADTTLKYPNYKSSSIQEALTVQCNAEMLKQWSNVLGVTAVKNATNTSQSGYTQSIYGDGTKNTAQLVGYSAAGVGHTVPVHETQDLSFFGIA